MRDRFATKLVSILMLVLAAAGCGASHDASMDAAVDGSAEAAVDGSHEDAGPDPERDAWVRLDSGTDAAASDCPSGCDDGVACTYDACVDTACAHEPVHADCGAGAVCDRTLGCMMADICATEADCTDVMTDPCIVSAICDPSLRVCNYERLDGDGDGHSPIVCGGNDCDDGAPTRYPTAPESCNGIDDDCDGAIDTPLAADACPPGQSCVDGACSCGGGLATCGEACADTSTDPAHCGDCFMSCRASELCVAGACQCPGTLVYCLDSCRDTTTDADHCGACLTPCPAGAACVGSTCGCPPGEMVCFGSCTDLSSDPLSCGACAARCLEDARCASGSCHPAVTWAQMWDSTDLWPSAERERVAVGSSGAVVVAGQARGEVRDPVTGLPILGSRSRRAFVIRMDGTGAIIWARDYPAVMSTRSTTARDVALDSTDGVVWGGQFVEGLYVEATFVAAVGGADGIAVRLDSTGSVVWSKRFGSAAIDTVNAVDVDGFGAVVVSGIVGGDLDFGGGARPLVGLGGFVARYGLDGSHLSSWRLPGEPVLVETDGAGDVWVAGVFRGTVDFGSGPMTATSTDDLFVARYSSTGALRSVFAVDGGGVDRAHGLGLLAGDVILSSTLHLAARYTSSGTLVWGVPRTVDAATFVDPRDLEVTSGGNVVVVGGATGAFDFGRGPGRMADHEGFIALYGPSGSLIDVGQTLYSCTRPDCGYLRGVGVASTGSMFVAGYFDSRLLVGPHEFMSPSSSWSGVVTARFEP